MSKSTFIDLFLEHTREYESPTSFWKWSSLITIAAALRDSVWLPDGEDKLYPNDYVLFLADSGARKGRPVSFSENLINQIGVTKVISGRASIQGILDELMRSETDTSGKLIQGGCAIFYAPELASGIVGSPEAIDILTDIYEGKQSFSSLLRHAPKFKIKQLVFNAFMASNEDMCRELINVKAKKGGFLARTLLIVPDEFRPSNPLTEITLEASQLKEVRLQDLVKKIKAISALKGQMIFEPKGKYRYDNWYADFRNSYGRKGDPAGIASRMHTHVKKIAMVFAANTLNMEISEECVDTAISHCVGLIPNYNRFIMTTGKSTVAEAAGIIIHTLMNSPEKELSRKELLEKHWNEVDAETLDKVAVTLEEAGLLRSKAVAHGMTYQLTQKMIEKMEGTEKK